MTEKRKRKNERATSAEQNKRVNEELARGEATDPDNAQFIVAALSSMNREGRAEKVIGNCRRKLEARGVKVSDYPPYVQI